MGVAEALIDLFWWGLSGELRQTLAQRIQAADAIAGESYPPRHTWVYSRNAHNRELFKRALVPEFIQDFYETEARKLPPYSLIATCRNERGSVESWLQSVVQQTALPSQVVICDAGSTDGTVEAVHSWCTRYNNQASADRLLQIIVVELPGCNIAAGRNRAAELAVHPILLCTDLGCRLTPQWAELMMIPFLHRADTEVVCGWYEALPQSRLAENYLRFLIPRLENINPDTFLPSARSLGIARELLSRVGGFPEFLTRAGEDSLFDYYLRWNAERWAFVPDAIVEWQSPKTLPALFRTTRSYAQGDAEGGKLFWSHYLWLLRGTGKLLIEVFAASIVALLFLVTEEWGLLFILLFLALVLGLRLRTITKPFNPARIGERPVKQVLSDWLCLGTFCLSQALGFGRGLVNRGEVERRRIFATRGTYICCTAEPLVPDAAIVERLEEGWFILNLSSRGVRRFDHPHYDLYYLSSISVDALIAKYLGRPNAVVLSVEPDSGLSPELARKLEALVREPTISDRAFATESCAHG